MTTGDQWLAQGLRPLHVKDYVYHSPDGVPVVRKRRFALMNISDGKDSGQKTFSVQHRSEVSIRLKAQTWENDIGPWGEELLYHRPELDRAILAGEDICICEGEGDADAVAQSWGRVSTTHYQGAAGWRANQAAVLKGHEGPVWIVMDNDTVGVQIAWRTLRQLVDVGLEKDQLQFLAPVGDFKDIREQLTAGVLAPEAISYFKVKAFVARHGELPVWQSNNYYGYSAGDREFTQALRDGWQVTRAPKES